MCSYPDFANNEQQFPIKRRRKVQGLSSFPKGVKNWVVNERREIENRAGPVFPIWELNFVAWKEAESEIFFSVAE